MVGMTVSLLVKTETGKDQFNAPVYSEAWEDVPGVLVGEPSTEDLVSDMQLYGKRLAYTLAIPKGDNHIWTDTKVKFWGQVFSTYGNVTQGIEANIPLKWNKKVKVEAYG